MIVRTLIRVHVGQLEAADWTSLKLPEFDTGLVILTLPMLLFVSRMRCALTRWSTFDKLCCMFGKTGTVKCEPC